jgi:hypothetical protein
MKVKIDDQYPFADCDRVELELDDGSKVRLTDFEGESLIVTARNGNLLVEPASSNQVNLVVKQD